MDQIVFTPSAILDLLSQIEELADKDINVTEFGDGGVQITIGESTYTINVDNAVDVEAPQEVVEDVSEANSEAYEGLGEDTLETVEGGLIKTVVKALLLRGLVKLSTQLID